MLQNTNDKIENYYPQSQQYDVLLTLKSFKSILLSLTILIFLSLNLSCETIDKNTPTSILPKSTTQDKFPAFNRELIINFNGDSIAGYAFIASGNSIKETVILVAGYPGNDNNFDVAQEIRRNGKNVIHFNHRGAWGSQGNYTYSNCLEDINLLITYLSQNEIAEKLRIAPNQFVLLGRSFGGGIALIAGSQIEEVKKIIAVSSVNYGAIMKKYNELKELSSFKKYMKKQIMINTNIDNFLQEMLDHKKKFNIINYNELLKNKKVLLIEDSNKNEKWINELDNKEYILLESDHNFIDKRLEMINLIIDWIKK